PVRADNLAAVSRALVDGDASGAFTRSDANATETLSPSRPDPSIRVVLSRSRRRRRLASARSATLFPRPGCTEHALRDHRLARRALLEDRPILPVRVRALSPRPLCRPALRGSVYPGDSAAEDRTRCRGRSRGLGI